MVTCIYEALEGFYGYRDIDHKIKAIRDIFVNISRDTGYLDQFWGYGDTMLSEFWGYLPYLF